MVLYRWVSYFVGMLRGFKCVGLWHACEPTVCGAGMLRSSTTVQPEPLGVLSTDFLWIWEVISHLEMGI